MTGLTTAKALSMPLVELARIVTSDFMSHEDRATAADALRARSMTKASRDWIAMTFAEKQMVRDAAAYAGTNYNNTGA